MLPVFKDLNFGLLLCYRRLVVHAVCKWFLSGRTRTWQQVYLHSIYEGMVMEGILWQATNHGEQGQLSKVDDGFPEKIDSNSRGVLVESLQVLECAFVVGFKNLDFRCN